MGVHILLPVELGDPSGLRSLSDPYPLSISVVLGLNSFGVQRTLPLELVGVWLSATSEASWDCSRLLRAASSQRWMIARSIAKHMKAGSLGSVHELGKSNPNTGVRAYRISQQKVAATAFAASKGTQ